jgi:HSP20 family molecular chaperone IbpA
MKQYPGFAHLFDDFFNSNFGVSQAGLLKTDIREANGNYELNMEVPGFKKEDIHIELSQGYLNIKASRNNTEEEKDESAGQDEKPEEKDQELEAVLKIAQERNDEHEAEKKARMRKAPLPPNEKDW